MNEYTAKIIDEIKDAIIAMKSSERDKLAESLQGFKSNVEDSSKNFVGLIKAFQSGLVKSNMSRTKLESVLINLSDLTSSNSDAILKVLTDNKVLIKSTEDQIEEFKKSFDSDLSGDFKVQLEGSTEYQDLFKTLEEIRLNQLKVTDEYKEQLNYLDESLEKYDETLSRMSEFNRQLESLGKEYENHNHLQDISSLGFSDNKAMLAETMILASQYSDILSSAIIPSESADNVLREAEKLRGSFGDAKFSIFDLEDVSFDKAFTKLSSAFETEKNLIGKSMEDLQNDVYQRLLDVSGYKIEIGDSGLAELYKLTEDGFNRISGSVETKILTKTKKMADYFNLIGELNAINLTKTKNIGVHEERRLQLAQKLHAAHVTEGRLNENSLKSKEELLGYLDSESEMARSYVSTLSDKHKLIMAIDAAAISTLRTQEYAMSVRLKELAAMKKYKEALIAVDGIGKSIQSTVSSALIEMPDWIKNITGMDQLEDELSTAFSASFDTFKDSIANGASTLEGLAAYAQTFSSTLIAAISPLTIILASVVAIGAMAYSASSNIKEFSSQLGIAKSQSSELYESMLKMQGAAGNLTLTQGKLLSIQEASLQDSGQLLDLTKKSGKELSEYASLIENVYGVGVKSGYELIDIFQELGADDALANNLAASVLEAATLANIAPDIIAQDLIDGAEDVATFFGNMPEAAAKAAIEVRRMGSNVKDVGELMKKTWSVESFMGDMAELGSLTGIDLSPVFDAGISGDMVKTQKALVDSIGSLDYFNDLMPQAKSKLADTLGMSVTQIANMMKLNEESLNLTAEEQKLLNENLSTMGDISGMSKEALKSRAKEFAAADAMNMAWTKIKTTFTRALLPLVEVFSDILVGISPILDIIGLGFKLIGLALKPFIPGLKLISSVLVGIGDVIQWLTEKLDDFLGGLTEGNGVVAKLTSSFSGLGGQFVSLGLLALVFKKQWTSALGSVFEKFTGMGKLAGMGGIGNSIDSKKTNTILNKVKEKFTSSKEKISSVFKKQNTTTSTTATSNVDTKGFDFKSMQDKVSKGFGSISKAIKSGLKSLGESIKSGLTFIKDVGTGIADAIMEPLKKVASGVGSMIESLVGSLGKGLSKFSPKALIGAGALIILSGALWITSKALQNFNDVEWESVAKAGVSLIGLAGIAMLMGSAVPQMLLGALAIGILGAALIPAAYALNMFNDVEWSSLAKAAVALIGLAAAAAGLSFIAPLILVGSMAIAALGASLIVFGAGIAMTAIGVDKLADVGTKILTTLGDLKEISPMQLIGIAAGLTAIGTGLATMTIAAGAGGIMALFAGNPLAKILALASTAPMINLLAVSMSMLSDSLIELKSTLSDLNIGQLNKLSDIKGLSDVNIRRNMSEVSKTSSTSNANIKSTSSLETKIESAGLKIAAAANEAAISKINNNNETYNSSSNKSSIYNNASDGKMEKLVLDILNAIHKYGNNPAPVVIGNKAVKELGKQIKRNNNN